MPEFQLICCIVEHNKGTKTLKEAKLHGVKGGTLFIGKGTAHSRILDILDLNDLHKEIVWMIAESEVARLAAEKIARKMAFHKKGHGIAVIFPLNAYIGTGNIYQNIPTTEMENAVMYNAIFTIVEKGNAQTVVDTATQAGAKGATIWNGRGSGIHETEVLFTMPIEPEREIVMIITETELIQDITAAIRSTLEIDEPGNGIIFIMPVSQIYGLSSLHHTNNPK